MNVPLPWHKRVLVQIMLYVSSSQCGISSVSLTLFSLVPCNIDLDYAEALVLAGLESLSDKRVGACKEFMATARQMSPLKNIIPCPAAFESHYSMRVQLPRRQHGHTRRINDFVTYKFQ